MSQKNCENQFHQFAWLNRFWSILNIHYSSRSCFLTKIEWGAECFDSLPNFWFVVAPTEKINIQCWIREENNQTTRNSKKIAEYLDESKVCKPEAITKQNKLFVRFTIQPTSLTRLAQAKTSQLVLPRTFLVKSIVI